MDSLNTLHDLLTLASARKSTTALVTAENAHHAISYTQLADICRSLGHHLRYQCHLQAGDVVSIVLPRRTSLAQVIGTLGAMVARLVAAPLNPTYKVEELEFFLDDAQAKVVLIEAANESGRSAWLAATKLKLPTCAMNLDWSGDAPRLTMSEMSSSSATGHYRSEQLDDVPTTDDVALVLHTSGTTSRPKLVPLTHGNMCASVRAVIRHYQIVATDATLIVQPLFHIGGLVTPLLSSLTVGGRVVIASMFDDARHWQFVAEHGVTWFTAVPTIHKVLLANAARDFAPHNFASGEPPKLRFIRSGSAALPPDFLAKIEASFGAPLIESYGMTEAAQLICANPLPPGKRYAGSVGICAGPEGRVFDAETGRRAALDEDGSQTGEMCIAGESVMLGYARNPSANEGSFVADPDEGPNARRRWFRTGDLVMRTAEGYYSIVGRIKEIINRAGEKIAPAKLDKTLAYEGRKDSVVCFGVPDPDFGQAVAAAIVFDPEKFPDDKDTYAECRRRAELLIKTALDKLAPHELPTTVFSLHKDEVPKTATGKTKRIKTGELCVEKVEPIVKNGVWREPPAHLPAANAITSTTQQTTAAVEQEEVGAAASAASAMSIEDARAKARLAIAEALTAVGVPLAVADDSPLMQSGLTSMMVFGFVRALTANLELDHPLPHMLVFDAPTPAALSAELADRLVADDAAPSISAAAAAAALLTQQEPAKTTAIAAASWRLPSLAADGTARPDAVRAILDECASVGTHVPASRWSAEAMSAALGKVSTDGILARCQQGGFVDGLDFFDNAKFGISKAEAQLMDPQQRMLMEHGHAALVTNDGPLNRADGSAYDIGVFVGVSFHDWGLLTLWNGEATMRKSAFASSGTFTSVASGRLSFALGLRGPCVTVNTACSSGLVALQNAHAAVASKDAPDGALAAATNVMLEPTISINFAVKGITSPRGRCYTFDHSADGYLRSEACVCVRVAQDDSDSNTNTAAAKAATTQSVVIRHDGRSASLTAPNGAAQLAMLKACRGDSESRSFVEAHGTATPLGDPIEIGALTRLAATSPSNMPRRFAVSGAKCSFGHCEAVAGSVGLLALLLATRAEHVAPNGALCKINPSIRDALISTAMLNIGTTDTTPTPATPVGGVSSLGASGTIAHAVLEPNAFGAIEAAGVLAKPWPVYSTRHQFPWKPYEPVAAASNESDAILASGSNDLANKPPGSPTSVIDTVRIVAQPYLEDHVDDDAALFDAGLDSIVAIELVAELQAKFEPLELPQTLLVDYPSMADIARFISTKVTDQDGKHTQNGEGRAFSRATTDDEEFPNTEGEDGPTVVVKKKRSACGEASPLVGSEQLFFVHGVDGDPLAMLFHQLAAELQFPSSTVRCIEAPKEMCATLEELAAYYVARIKERQPSGKYRIFGHSFGALVAHQIALQLERAGDEVAALVLGDFEVTYPPSRSRNTESDKGRFGLEEWEGGEIESIKLACRRFGSYAADGTAFDPDEFRAKVLEGAKSASERRMRAMFHYMPAYMQRREWDRLLDLWERNMEYLYTVTVPKFGPKRRKHWQPDGIVKGPTLHLRALGSHEFSAAVEINRKYCADYHVQALPGLHYTFLQKPNATSVAKAITDFVTAGAENLPPLSTGGPRVVAAAPISSSTTQGKDGIEYALAAPTLPAVLAAHARRRGSAACLVAWERKGGEVESVTYGELASRVCATAARLSARGLMEGDAIAILSHASVAAHVVVMAAMTARLRSVMLNPRLPADVLALLCVSAKRCVGVCTGLALREIAAHFAPGVASSTLVMLGSEDEAPADLREDETLLETSRGDALASADLSALEAPICADAPCVLMFTSGTTGSPKPIERSHRHILIAVDRMRRFEAEQGLYEDEASNGHAASPGTLSFLPLYHMMGFTHNFALNLRRGGRVLVHAGAPYMPLTLGLLLEAAPALKPTAVESIVVVAEQLSEMLALGGDMTRDIAKRIASVKYVKVGGSPIARRVVRNLEAHGLRVVSHFGQSELCGYVLAAVTPRDRLGAAAAKELTDELSKSPSMAGNLHRVASASDIYGNDEDPNYLVEEKRREAALSFEDADMRPVDLSMSLELRGTSPFAPSNGALGQSSAVHNNHNKCRHYQTGELVVKRGLWGSNDEQSYATGDIFAVSESGGYTFRARLDGMLVLGSGEMLDPVAIETKLMRLLAKYLKRCCLVGNGRPRPALVVELRESARHPHTSQPLHMALDAIADAVSQVKSLDTATAILPTHIIILPEIDTLPTTLKGAVDTSAALANVAEELANADRGLLIPNSLQALKVNISEDSA